MLSSFEVSEGLAPGVVCLEVEAVTESPADLRLKCVVVGPRSIAYIIRDVGIRVREVSAQQLRCAEVTTTEVGKEERLVDNEEVESSGDLALSKGRLERSLIKRKRAKSREYLKRLPIRTLSGRRIDPGRSGQILRAVEEIKPRALEIVKETTCEDPLLIEVDAARQLHAAVSNVSNFSDRVAENFTLDAKVPLLHIRRAQVRIDGEQCGRGIFIFEDIANRERKS